MNSFSKLHPVNLFCFYTFLIMISVFLQNPVYQCVSAIGGGMFLCCLQGVKKGVKKISSCVFFGAVIAVLNPLFSHNGITPLFFINDSAYTLEALVCGCGLALSVISVILWFATFNTVFDSEKSLYLFGKISPKLSMLFSMVLGFVPRLLSRYKEILSVQKNFCKKPGLRLYIDCFSAVITHSLEDTVDMSDSMTARGFGSKNPTVFSRFKFDLRDGFSLFLFLAFTGTVILPCFAGGVAAVYYPRIIFPDITPALVVSYAAFAAMCLTPFLFEVTEELKWKYTVRKI